MRKSVEHSYRAGRGFAPVAMTAAQVTESAVAALRRIGIEFAPGVVANMVQAHAMDGNDVGIAPASINTLTTPSISTPVQFLQAWLPGFVSVLTAAREIDTLVGISTAGSWEDEEIVQGILEPVGGAVPYTDHGNTPLMSWNPNFERRTVIRFEAGIEVGMLEEARAARIRISTSAEKRGQSAEALEIQRNRIGFYGYNGGANRTFGFLNDPSLPAYVTVPNGASASPLWSSKTMLEIVRDIRVALSSLRTGSKGKINPKKTPITLAIATSRVDFLTTTSDFGVSVLSWLSDNYPNVRIESAPELDDANGGAAVFYAYADTVDDGSTDDKRTWVQVVPSKFMALGVDKRIKTYAEAYSSATAGVLLKRPFAVRRYTGI